jgi:hypothetical protein
MNLWKVLLAISATQFLCLELCTAPAARLGLLGRSKGFTSYDTVRLLERALFQANNYSIQNGIYLL